MAQDLLVQPQLPLDLPNRARWADELEENIERFLEFLDGVRQPAASPRRIALLERDRPALLDHRVPNPLESCFQPIVS
jgi:hypothetical protein